jgi:hypothetical protein
MRPCRLPRLTPTGAKLEPEQIQKVQAESQVIAEIKALGGTV